MNEPPATPAMQARSASDDAAERGRHGRGIAPGAPQRRRRFCWRPATASLAARRKLVSCSSTKRPSCQLWAHRRTQLRIPSSRSRLSAVATARSHTFALRAIAAWIEATAGVVQEVEDQRVQPLQPGMPDGSAVPATGRSPVTASPARTGDNAVMQQNRSQ
jgi:hypothetical protein